MEENTKTRYSDEELEEFRGIINGMLDKARAEYGTLKPAIPTRSSRSSAALSTECLTRRAQNTPPSARS